MKIAFIAPTYLPSRRANTIQVMKMAQAMVSQGHHVHVLVPNPNDQPTAAWDQLSHHYGLSEPFEVEWIRCAPGLRSYDYALKAVRRAQGYGADLVYTRLPQAATLASQRKIPTVLEVHDMPGGFMGRRLFRSFLRGGGTQRLVVITRALLDDLQKEFGNLKESELTLVAPDGIDLERYENLPEPEDARQSLQPEINLPDGFTAGYSGNLYSGRGIHLIMDMAGDLADIHFLLIGGSPEEVDRYRQIAESRNLENVHFTGFVPNAELPTYQAACNVLLMPYQKQVAASSGGDISAYLSPMKVFEYMASGRAILSSDLPVLKEVLTEENAVLLPPDDLDSWKNAIVELREAPERRKDLAEQALEDVQEYTWAQRVEKIFSGLSI